MRQPQRLVLALIVLVAAGPVRASEPAGSPPGGSGEKAANLPAGDVDSIWEYLCSKYDPDGDGTIELKDYDRGKTAFSRLDRNGDGVLTAKDFRSSRGSRRGMSPERMNAMMSRMLLVSHFQADDIREELALSEVEESFTAYDRDKSGTIDPEEFMAEQEERRARVSPMIRRGLRGSTSFDVLLRTADENDDKVLSKAELVAHFKAQDEDGDGKMSFGFRPRPGGTRPKSGAPEGEPAPDFTLKPPKGGIPITLSSFKGKKPVALIFGSYT